MKNYTFDFKDIVDHAKDVVMVTKAEPIDAPGPEIVYVNHAFTELTGYSEEEAIGQNPRMLQSIETDSATRQIIREALQQEKPVRVSVKNFTKHHDAYWLDLSIIPLRDARGKVTHFAAIERDVTEQQLLEQKLSKLSMTDMLTDVLNRRGFDVELEKEHSRFSRTGQRYALLQIDFDNFKTVNDCWGHETGDAVLKHFSSVCNSCLRLHDIFSRYGGEEFCALLPSTNIFEARITAEKVRQTVMQSALQHDGSTVRITVSVGVAEVTDIDQDHLAVLKRADKMLYEAKHAGRNCLRG